MCRRKCQTIYRLPNTYQSTPRHLRAKTAARVTKPPPFLTPTLHLLTARPFFKTSLRNNKTWPYYFSTLALISYNGTHSLRRHRACYITVSFSILQYVHT